MTLFPNASDVGRTVRRVAKRWARALRSPVDDYRRRCVDFRLAEFRNGPSVASAKTVVYDGTFDNPNHWLRCAITSRALGLASARQYAFTGRFADARVRRMFARWGNIDVRRLIGSEAPSKKNREEADAILDSARSPQAFLEWRFDCGLPASDVYDSLLKRQRRGTLDFADPNISLMIAEILATHDAAARMFDEIRPDIYVASHTASANTAYGAVLWAAISRGIETIVPWGAAQSLRLYRVRKWADAHAWASVLTCDQLRRLSPEKKRELERLGRTYIDARVGGEVADASADYAYRRPKTYVDRAALCAQFGWSPTTPIVAIYASVWFDNPHVFGMTSFADFDDWLRLSARVASKVTGINFLFKPHPSEQFYGGPKLAEMLQREQTSANVAMCPDGWNGSAVIGAVDAIVTLHGTIGVEASVLGVPVMTAGPGWYDHLGFTKMISTREEYESALGIRWWDARQAEEASRLAALFAGWYFAPQADGCDISFGEDHEGHGNLTKIIELVDQRRRSLESEATEIGAWWNSGTENYYSFKMGRRFGLSV